MTVFKLIFENFQRVTFSPTQPSVMSKSMVFNTYEFPLRFIGVLESKRTRRGRNG